MKILKVPQYGFVQELTTMPAGYVRVQSQEDRQFFAKPDDVSMIRWLSLFQHFLPDWNFFLHPRAHADVIVVDG